MSGLYTDGVPNLSSMFGLEQAPWDTQLASGANPQSGSLNLQELSLWMSYFTDSQSKTMVASTRYYRSIPLGFPYVATGCLVKLGATGGTDNWIVELHGPTGLLLATSATAGTLAGTANTWQQIAFTATYNMTNPGTYFLALQSNGTTATFSSINVAATTALLTGSATGTFGTGASITPPTTYTANLGPKILLY